MPLAWRPGRAVRQLALGLLPLAALAGPAAAQTGNPFLSLGVGPPVVTLDQERLFADSAFGRRVTGAVEEAVRNLAAENRSLEETLAAEERALTELRATLPPDEFRALADAFDARVEGIRARQESRSRAIADYRDAERQRFFELALPVLAQAVAEAGAVAVLDTRAIVLALDDIDITDRVLARLDTTLGDGAGPGPSQPELAEPEPGSRPPMPRPAPPVGPPLALPEPPAVD